MPYGRLVRRKEFAKAGEGDKLAFCSDTTLLCIASNQLISFLEYNELKSIHDSLADRIGRVNKEQVIEDYATAERRDEVLKVSNNYAKSPETYARGLWNDGMRKC